MKVHEYAKERGLESKDITEALKTLIETETLPEGTSTSASSKLDENELAALKEYFRAADEVLEEEAADDQEPEESTEEAEEEAVEPEPEEENNPLWFRLTLFRLKGTFPASTRPTAVKKQSSFTRQTLASCRRLTSSVLRWSVE